MKYTQDNRGIIQYRERAKQIISFQGIQYGNITPTDIDGLIEYKDLAVIFIELKYKDAEMPYGQQLAFQRLADDISESGRECIVLICSHNVDDCQEDIVAAETDVKLVYWDKKWKKANRNLKEMIDSFLKYVIEKKLFA